MMRTVFVVSLLAVSGCGSQSRVTPPPAPPPEPAPAPVAADETSYYLGTSDVLGMDGTVYVDDAPSILERTVSPRTGTITETVYVQFQGAMMTSTLRQTDDPQVFQATDEKASYSGTLTYAGDPWNPTGWTYDITLADNGGTITGTAKFSRDEISAEKLFTDGGGQPRARILDVVKRVTKEEYLAKRKEIAGN